MHYLLPDDLASCMAMELVPCQGTVLLELEHVDFHYDFQVYQHSADMDLESLNLAEKDLEYPNLPDMDLALVEKKDNLQNVLPSVIGAFSI